MGSSVGGMEVCGFLSSFGYCGLSDVLADVLFIRDGIFACGGVRGGAEVAIDLVCRVLPNVEKGDCGGTLAASWSLELT